MAIISVGEVIQVRFGNDRAIVKNSKILAIKPGNLKTILVESTDSTLMGTIVSREDVRNSDLKTDSFCFIGSTGHPRDKAARILGFKDLKLK